MNDEKKPDDTENKQPWLKFGEQREETFINELAPEIGLDVQRNPKKDQDPTALDLLAEGEPADLKTQETPFFTANKNYNMDAQYVVTFNANDYNRYKQKDNPMIYFWVRWRDQLADYGVTLNEMEGIWKIEFEGIEKLVESNNVPCHSYKRRKGDAENANSSYLLDLRKMDCIECFDGPC